MNTNTFTDNATKIQAWRDANPDAWITEQILLDILGVDSLYNADLTGANLWGADLRGADLTFAYLWDSDLTSATLADANMLGANLTGADLRGADLTGANLTSATLADTDLRGAGLTLANLRYTRILDVNLTGSTGGVAEISNIYRYPATLQPTPDGWYTRVGCWYGTLNELRKIAVSDNDEDWPEATGEERERRRPLLQSIVSVFDAHVINHPDIIRELNNRWGE